MRRRKEELVKDKTIRRKGEKYTDDRKVNKTWGQTGRRVD